jgi:hypothetical protein
VQRPGDDGRAAARPALLLRSGHRDLGRVERWAWSVGFAFQGWSARTVVEIKLMRNSSLWDGILALTPPYAIPEEVMVAFLVAIAYD